MGIKLGNEKGLSANWREKKKNKKVIFYNTSVGTMLSGNEAHIRKMNWVFDVFQKNPEIVLWWRPHPLELSTVQSMRSDLGELYRKTRERYVTEDIGVLDESTDVHRALAVSDAYYGDYSSVVTVYKATGKPVLVAKDNILKHCNEVNYSIRDFVIVERNMWFISDYYNFLFKMDMDFKITEIIHIPGERYYETTMSSALIHDKGCIVIISNKDNRLFVRKKTLIYNIESKKLLVENFIDNKEEIKGISAYWVKKTKIGEHIISIKENVIELYNINTQEEKHIIQFPTDYRAGEYAFTAAVACDNCVYLFPNQANMVLKFELDSGAIAKVNITIDENYMYAKYTCAKRVGDKIYAFAGYRNVWQIIDIKTEEYEEHSVIADNLQEEKITGHSLFDVNEGNMSDAPTFYYAEDQVSITLEKYISSVINTDMCIKYRRPVKMCGEIIHEKMKAE